MKPAGGRVPGGPAAPAARLPSSRTCVTLRPKCDVAHVSSTPLNTKPQGVYAWAGQKHLQGAHSKHPLCSEGPPQALHGYSPTPSIQCKNVTKKAEAKWTRVPKR